MIRDGKMSTEIRRKITFREVTGTPREQPLEEFVLVDGSGRVQIPREHLEQLKIRDRARLAVRDGRVELVPEEDRR
jgi:hypothetical protein